MRRSTLPWLLPLLSVFTPGCTSFFAIDGAQVEGYRLRNRSPESIVQWAVTQRSYDKLDEGEAALFTYHVNRRSQPAAAFDRAAEAYLQLYRSMASRVEPGVWAAPPVRTEDARLAADVAAIIRFVARCLDDYTGDSESEVGDEMMKRFRRLFAQMEPPPNSRFYSTWREANDSTKTERRGSPPHANAPAS